MTGMFITSRTLVLITGIRLSFRHGFRTFNNSLKQVAATSSLFQHRLLIQKDKVKVECFRNLLPMLHQLTAYQLQTLMIHQDPNKQIQPSQEVAMVTHQSTTQMLTSQLLVRELLQVVNLTLPLLLTTIQVKINLNR